MCVRRGWTKPKRKKTDKWEMLITLALLSTHVSYETYRQQLKAYRAERRGA
jgi:hypothetical protein